MELGWSHHLRLEAGATNAHTKQEGSKQASSPPALPALPRLHIRAQAQALNHFTGPALPALPSLHYPPSPLLLELVPLFISSNLSTSFPNLSIHPSTTDHFLISKTVCQDGLHKDRRARHQHHPGPGRKSNLKPSIPSAAYTQQRPACPSIAVAAATATPPLNSCFIAKICSKNTSIWSIVLTIPLSRPMRPPMPTLATLVRLCTLLSYPFASPRRRPPLKC